MMEKKEQTLRKTTPEDADLLAALHAASFPVAERWSAEQIAGSLCLPTTRGWVAFDGEKFVGFILGQCVEGEAEVLTFCVDPAARRRQWGQKLLQEFLASLAPETRVFLEAAEDNAPARRLYEKCGFVKEGLRRAYYHRGGASIDAAIYSFKTARKEGLV